MTAHTKVSLCLTQV